jgi:ABC-type multidrug transport system permease subunit
LLIIGVLQSILFTLTLYLFYDGKIVSINSFLFTLFWLVFVTAVSSVFGLVISAAMNNTEKVMSLIPIVLIPQIMLAGMLANISNVFVEIVSYFTLSRWGTEGLTVIQDDIITVRTSADGSSNKIVNRCPQLS